MVTTLDKRKQSLVFKAVIYELRSDILLVEFRRSKVCNWIFHIQVVKWFNNRTQGDGIEFKKIFKRIKEMLSDIICKPPSIQWQLYVHLSLSLCVFMRINSFIYLVLCFVQLFFRHYNLRLIQSCLVRLFPDTL